jgi:hypothetical protein
LLPQRVLMFISQSIIDQYQIALVRLLFCRAIILIRFCENNIDRTIKKNIINEGLTDFVRSV